MQNIADQVLPPSMAYDWTELTYMQLQAGNTAMYVFALAVVFVFLVLAAQYESWKLPLAVILVVPMCLLCSVRGRRQWPSMDINIFTQIGFVVLVGPGQQERDSDRRIRQAAARGGRRPPRGRRSEACRLRLRPILMTSFAFILGVVPLVIAEGAGAEMRRTLGMAVFSGMLGVTLFGIFLTPVFYDVIQRFGKPPTRIGQEPPGDAHARLPSRPAHTTSRRCCRRPIIRVRFTTEIPACTGGVRYRTGACGRRPGARRTARGWNGSRQEMPGRRWLNRAGRERANPKRSPRFHPSRRGFAGPARPSRHGIRS